MFSNKFPIRWTNFHNLCASVIFIGIKEKNVLDIQASVNNISNGQGSSAIYNLWVCSFLTAREHKKAI